MIFTMNRDWKTGEWVKIMENKLKLSVVIPCRNEVNHITDCVESVLNAAAFMSADVSVYVVDGKSDDGTIEKIEELHHKYPNVQLLVNEKQLTPFAFNIGIKANQDFDYLIIVGSRHILSENYFSEGINTFTQYPEVWCVGGTVNNVFINDTGRVIAAAMATTFGMGLGNFRTMTNSGFVDTIGTPIYPKKVFTEIGYFDEDLVRNQDDEFNFRVTQAGGKIYHNHLISVRYFVRGSYQGLWRQFFQYGYWKVYVNRKHKSVTTLRQLVPPLFVLYLLVSLLMFFVSLKLGVLALIPLLFYAIFAGVFALKAAQSKENIGFFSVLLTFPVLHISYGLGYLKGILDFVLLKKKPSEKQKRLSR